MEQLRRAPELYAAGDAQPPGHVKSKHARAHDRVGIHAHHHVVDASAVQAPGDVAPHSAHSIEDAYDADLLPALIRVGEQCDRAHTLHPAVATASRHLVHVAYHEAAIQRQPCAVRTRRAEELLAVQRSEHGPIRCKRVLEHAGRLLTAILEHPIDHHRNRVAPDVAPPFEIGHRHSIAVEHDPTHSLRECARVHSGHCCAIRRAVEAPLRLSQSPSEQLQVICQRLRTHVLQKVVRLACGTGQLPVRRVVAPVGSLLRRGPHAEDVALVARVDVLPHVPCRRAFDVSAWAAVGDLCDSGRLRHHLRHLRSWGQSRLGSSDGAASRAGCIGRGAALRDADDVKPESPGRPIRRVLHHIVRREPGAT